MNRRPHTTTLFPYTTLFRSQPNFISWWDDVGPEGSTNHEVYLRTAVSVDPQGWAQFGHVKMRDYRWGIFLNPMDGEDRKSTRLNSSHGYISYAVFCLKKKNS